MMSLLFSCGLFRINRKLCFIAQAVSVILVTMVIADKITDNFEEPASKRTTVCSVVRYADKSGFHRDVHTSVVITPSESWGAHSACEVLMNETIPAGIFVDLYQTDGLHRLGGPKVYSSVDINLELPEFVSQPHTVYVYSPLTRHSNGSLTATDVVLPVHMRYHRPSDSHSHEQAVIISPRILVRCELSTDWVEHLAEHNVVTAPCSNDTSADCVWLPLSCDGAKSLSFDVPVGDLNQYSLVVYGTLFVTLTATAYLLIVMLRAPVSVDDSKKQQ